MWAYFTILLTIFLYVPFVILSLILWYLNPSFDFVPAHFGFSVILLLFWCGVTFPVLLIRARKIKRIVQETQKWSKLYKQKEQQQIEENKKQHELSYINKAELRKDMERNNQLQVAKNFELALQYKDAVKIYEEYKMWSDAKRVRMKALKSQSLYGTIKFQRQNIQITPIEAINRSRDIIEKLGWNITWDFPDVFIIQARIPFSLRSTGEQITIRIENDGGQKCLYIESAPVIYFVQPLYDWGKNQKNIDIFLRMFLKMGGK
jgi:hypothetical protein